ncbi:MAG: replication protein, partial [Thermoleophilia bacterium]
MAKVALDTSDLDRQAHSAPPQPAPSSELFVRFPIDLFDALLLSPMPATHKEVVLAVVRRTYGHFGKEQAPISLSLFLSMTERAERGVRDALRDLIAEGVLCRVVPATNRTAAVYRVETIIERWGRFMPSRPEADEQPG